MADVSGAVAGVTSDVANAVGPARVATPPLPRTLSSGAETLMRRQERAEGNSRKPDR